MSAVQKKQAPVETVLSAALEVSMAGKDTNVNETGLVFQVEEGV